MVLAYIGLGSNLGQREDFIERAIESLVATPGIYLRRRAGLYETEPVGIKDQPWFLNTVIEIETDLSPQALLGLCKQIEHRLGRQNRYGPREIDLDILLYDQLILSEPHLQIPHPELHRRRFVLAPLAELAPLQLHPVLRLPIVELLNALDTQEVIPLRSKRFSSRR